MATNNQSAGTWALCDSFGMYHADPADGYENARAGEWSASKRFPTREDAMRYATNAGLGFFDPVTEP